MEAETKAIAQAEPQLNVVEAIASTAPSRSIQLIRECIAITFWIYVVLKLFVFDVDVYAAQKFFPSAAWVLNFKFIILLCLAAILVLIFRSFSIVVWIAYIVFYPLIVLFWKIQRSLYKTQKWVVAFAILNATVSFFRSIRYNLLVSAIRASCGRRRDYCS